MNEPKLDIQAEEQLLKLAGEYEAFQRLPGDNMAPEELQRIVEAASEAYQQKYITERPTVEEGLEDTLEAPQQIWEHYFSRLVALAQVQPEGLQSDEDSGDTALESMRSLLRRLSQSQSLELDDRTVLWTLLAATVLRKMAQFPRRDLAEKRESRGEISLEAVIREEPTPKLATRLFEEANRLCRGLDDEFLQQVAKLKLEGYSNVEISWKVNKSVRTVERKLSLIRQYVTEELDR